MLITAKLRVVFVGRAEEPEASLLRQMEERIELVVLDPADRPWPAGDRADVIVATGAESPRALREMAAGAAIVILSDDAGAHDGAARYGDDGDGDVVIPRGRPSARLLELAIDAALERRAAARRRSGETASSPMPDFELIFEGAPLGIALITMDGVIRDVNPALARLLGYSRADLKEAPLSSVMDPLGNDTTSRTLFSRLRSGEACSKKERRLLRKDGSFVRAEVSTAVVRDRRGEPVALLQTVTDLTERHEAERALVNEIADRRVAESDAREAHEFLAAALQHIPAGVLIVERPSGEVVLVNERFHEVCGHPSIALALRDPSVSLELVREDGSPYPREDVPLLRTLRDGTACSADDVWIRGSDGSRRPLVCRSAPIPYKGRDAAILIVQDVTQIREQMRQARSAEALYHSLFDQGSDAIFVLTAEGRILESNPSGDRLFGREPGELQGSDVRSLAPAEQADGRLSSEVVAEMLSVGRRGARAVTPWRGLRKGGGLLELELRIQPIRLEGAPDLLVLQARDVTRQRVLEEELRKSQKLEAIGVLAGGVAHDYNNLLTGVIGFIELALDRLDKDDPCSRGQQARKFLGEALRAANRSSELTRQLLTFSRREKGRVELFDLNPSVERQGTMIRRLLGETRRLELSLAPEGCPIRGDAAQLDQVLLNLAINARDAMPKGGTLRIETSRYVADEVHGGALDLVAGEYVVLTVADEGTGMSESVRSRIFQPFFTTKERGRGTGLGLAVVHGVVQHHGGRIFVDSTLGAGSRFTIVLPCAGGERVTRDATRATGPLPRGKGRVLVVDDDPTVREVTGSMLETLGYDVASAPSAVEALEFIRSGAALDLVVTDVVMPQMSGVELEQRVRAERPGLAVLLVSGYAKDAFARHGLDDAAAPALLAKPLTIESLGTKVRELLARPPV